MGIPTWDLEAIGWSVPISIGFFDGYRYYEFLKQDEEDDLVWRFLTFLRQFSGIKLFAHCGGRYDHKFLLHTLCRRGEAIKLEAGMGRLRWLEPNIVFEDSYLLAPMRLAKLTQMLGVETKEEWDHSQTLNPWEMGDKLTTFRSYQKTDCISLSHAMTRLCEEIGGNFGVTPSITLATTAAKAFDKVFFNLDMIDSNEASEEFVRGAIYGARNEIYKRYGENLNVYDVRDMYVSCYDVPVPVGPLTWIRPNLDRGTLAEATVHVPKDFYIGPLPLRQKNRLIFPTGEFTGWWDIRELRLAAELGVDITIRRQLAADEEPALERFGEFVARLRGESLLAHYWKLFGVSVSGKFGQSRWRDSVKHVSAIKDFKAHVPIDKDEVYFRAVEYIKGKAPYIKPAITMRIRAEARIRHLRLLLEAKKRGEVCYCDTDSIFTTATMPTGPNSGDLNLINHAERGYFIRQKLYGIVVEGSLIQRSAGYSDLKLTEQDFQKLLAGEKVEFVDGELPDYRRLLSGADLSWIERHRQIHSNFSSNRQILDGDTCPIFLASPPPHSETPPASSLETLDTLLEKSHQSAEPSAELAG